MQAARAMKTDNHPLYIKINMAGRARRVVRTVGSTCCARGAFRYAFMARRGGNGESTDALTINFANRTRSWSYPSGADVNCVSPRAVRFHHPEMTHELSLRNVENDTGAIRHPAQRQLVRSCPGTYAWLNLRRRSIIGPEAMVVTLAGIGVHQLERVPVHIRGSANRRSCQLDERDFVPSGDHCGMYTTGNSTSIGSRSHIRTARDSHPWRAQSISAARQLNAILP